MTRSFELTGSPTRRRVLRAGGASMLGVALAGCTGSDNGDGDAPADTTDSPDRSDDSTTTSSAATSTSGPAPAAGTDLTAADFAGLGTCILLPEQMAGPFPLDEQFDRRDITEGYPGHPLRLGLRVVDESCEPIAGAAVEVWHADSSGDYSAYIDDGGGKDEAEGTTFLRGTQVANSEGIVEFQTIYPGWYTGRAVHIHLRVHIDGEIVRTSQMYFDDAYTEQVFADAPYAEFGPPDTPTAADSIAGDTANDGTLLTLRAAETSAGAGTLALLNLGVPA